MEDGKTLLFDLDVQGALYFKEYFQNKAAVIFIQPPSLEELEQRLRDRGTETDEVIRERIKNARVELEKKDQFDYLVTNEDIDLAYAQIEQIFQSIIEG
jgi:guanylate kinase